MVPVDVSDLLQRITRSLTRPRQLRPWAGKVEPWHAMGYGFPSARTTVARVLLGAVAILGPIWALSYVPTPYYTIVLSQTEGVFVWDRPLELSIYKGYIHAHLHVYYGLGRMPVNGWRWYAFLNEEPSKRAWEHDHQLEPDWGGSTAKHWTFPILALVPIMTSLYFMFMLACRQFRRTRRRRLGRCVVCGYDLRGSITGRCSECGSPYVRRPEFKMRAGDPA